MNPLLSIIIEVQALVKRKQLDHRPSESVSDPQTHTHLCGLWLSFFLHLCIWQMLLSKATYCAFSVCVFLGIKPTLFALLTQCSNHWATGTLLLSHFVIVCFIIPQIHNFCMYKKSTTVIQTNRAAEEKPPERFTNWTNNTSTESPTNTSTHSTNHLLYYYSNINLDLSKKSTFISCDTTLDSVIDGDTCDDPRVWKNRPEHPWIWYKIYELIIMFLSNYSQQYSQYSLI